MKKLGFIIFLPFMLTGCSYFSTTGEHLFTQSRNGPGVVVPPPLCANYISNYYDLPSQDEDPCISVLPPSRIKEGS